jgi:hypothetical protein
MNKSTFHLNRFSTSNGGMVVKLLCIGAFFSFVSLASGCTTTSSQSSSSQSSYSAGSNDNLAGPAYYQSNDNPYHSD